MSKIRVLIVDDAVAARRIVSDTLSADPDIEIVGTAANGKIALAKIPQTNPDRVTLDPRPERAGGSHPGPARAPGRAGVDPAVPVRSRTRWRSCRG